MDRTDRGRHRLAPAPADRRGGRAARRAPRGDAGHSRFVRSHIASNRSQKTVLGRSSSRQPLREEIYERLRERIFCGELEPGMKLSPPELATEFGVSTMPVREALRLLGEEGLVEVAPRKWTRVCSPDPRLLDEIYPILALLERYALVSLPEVPIEAIAEARGANRALAEAAGSGDVVGCTQADDRFHEILACLNPNRTLQQTIASLKARTHLLESTYYRIGDASESVRQHSEILEALIANDLERAGRTVAENWEMGHAKLRAALAGE